MAGAEPVGPLDQQRAVRQPLVQPEFRHLAATDQDGPYISKVVTGRQTGLPVFNTSMGKGGIDEELPNFGGAYSGLGSVPAVREAVEASDAVFWIGNYPVSMQSSIAIRMKVGNAN